MGKPSRRILSVLENSAEEISHSDIFAALADEERQQLLIVLQEARTPEAIPAITRDIAAEMDQSGSEKIQSLRIRLSHTHIPKLAEAGLLVCDEDRDVVELTELGREIADALDP